jgi:hypothetical protein
MGSSQFWKLHRHVSVLQVDTAMPSFEFDAYVVGNGETAAPADCGVIACDSLVAARSARISAALTESSIRANCKRRNGKDFAARS